MEILASLIGRFYVFFIAITIFLLLALIGYFIDQKYPDEEKKKNIESKDLEAHLANAKGKTLNSIMSSENQNDINSIEVLDINNK